MALSSNWTGSWPLKPEIVSSSLRRVTSNKIPYVGAAPGVSDLCRTNPMQAQADKIIDSVMLVNSEFLSLPDEPGPYGYNSTCGCTGILAIKECKSSSREPQKKKELSKKWAGSATKKRRLTAKSHFAGRVHLLSDKDYKWDILTDRLHGSNLQLPAGKVESCTYLAPSSNRSRTPPFQGGNPGSSPGGVTRRVWLITSKALTRIL